MHCISLRVQVLNDEVYILPQTIRTIPTAERLLAYRATWRGVTGESAELSDEGLQMVLALQNEARVVSVDVSGC